MKNQDISATNVILDAFMAAKRGTMVIVLGTKSQVEDVIDYTLGSCKWRDLVCSQGPGKELVYELLEGSNCLRVWREAEEAKFADAVLFDDDVVVYDHENFEEDERGRPWVVVNGDMDQRKKRVHYKVLTSQSGNLLCFEEWDGRLRVYFSAKADEVPLDNIEIEE